MNRIYQSKVTAVEIHDRGYRLSRIGHSPQAQPFDTDTKKIGSNGSPHSHQPRNTPTTRNGRATKERKDHK